MPTFAPEYLMAMAALAVAVSQILLKFAANRKYQKWWQAYLNTKVILGYALMGFSVLMNILAFREVNYKWGPVIASSSYIFVLFLGRLFFKERLSWQRLLGAGLIISGILVFSL